MPYVLGVDVGNSVTTAATAHFSTDNQLSAAHPVELGLTSAAVPSIAFVTEDGQVLVGEAAEEAGLNRPERVVRDFRQRLGDPVPIAVGTLLVGAEQVFALLVRSVVCRTEEREGAPPNAISITHPTSWGDYRIAQVCSALADVGLTDVTLVSEAEAAARRHSAREVDGPGGIIAVYDLGGSTCDITILEEGASGGFRVLGDPGHVERLGGADFDELVFRRVSERAGFAPTEIDLVDEDALQAFRDVRRACTWARETLSFRTEATVPVALPGIRTAVRLLRSEFETMIDGAVQESIDLFDQTLATTGLAAEDIGSVLLVGGTSHTPFVARRLAGRLGRPVITDSDPAAALALGAAQTGALGMIAARAAESRTNQRAPVPVELPSPGKKTRHGVRRPVVAAVPHRMGLGPRAARATARAVPVGVSAVVAGLILTVVAAQGAGFSALSQGQDGRPDMGAGEWFTPESLRADGIPGFPFGVSTGEPAEKTDATPFLTPPPPAGATEPGPQAKRAPSRNRQQATDEATRASLPQPTVTKPRTEPPPTTTADTTPEPPPAPAPEPESVPDPDPDPPAETVPDPDPDPAPEPDPVPDPAPDPVPDPDPEPAPEPDPVVEPPANPV